MIRHASLLNWKAFAELELDLPAGTSFIVARNGVGKTSLLQALHFGMFGDRRLLGSGSSVHSAVRGGEGSQATVSITVELEGVRWVITRQVPGALKARDQLSPPRVTRDGDPASDSAWERALEAAAGIGLTELRLLAAIGEGGTLSTTQLRGPDQYNLIQHLSEVLGVARMRDMAADLRRLAKETSASADQERLQLRDRRKRAAFGELEQLSSERMEVARRVEEVSRLLAEVQERQRTRRAMVAWTEREQLRRAEAVAALSRIGDAIAVEQALLEEILDQPAPAIPARSDDEGTEAWMQQLAAAQRRTAEIATALRTHRDSLLRAGGGSEARIAAIGVALRLLTDAHAICPTCRQPLSPEAAEDARQAHLREREELQARESSIRSEIERVDMAIQSLEQAAAAFVSAALPRPPELAAGTDEISDQSASEALTAELGAGRTRLEAIDVELQVIQADAEARAGNEALSTRLVERYRRADLASLTAQSFEALADSICRERINPLAGLLEKRYSELWPGRPSLTLDVTTGEVVGRTAGVDVSLADLSGGERAVALVLLRLLALQSASSSPILLMDEPLEHLDPRNRRLLASLLVAATAGDEVACTPRQVLVTTYEESVTRRLDRQVAGAGSNVIYVSGRPQSLASS
jgi:ABC-type lipoprotein export system ATPase subunit